ncbi:MAG TPA: hypothetical protein VGX51_09215 [Solirubrobacteraceae bacterium]|jgi:hypothetical protein|nr:hypothetical protein [Solirubrobacteraceae bacterium]
MSDRVARLAPLTGVLFALLVVVGTVVGSESPGTEKPASKIVAYYETHSSEVKASAVLFALAFLALIGFGAALRSYARRSPSAEGVSVLMVAGSVLVAAGALTASGVEFGLAKEIHHLGPEAVKTLNFITEEVAFLPIIGGAFVFAIGAGLTILRGAPLPRWLGWVAIVLGIAALIPPASFPSLLGFAIWSVIVSVLVYKRTAPDAAQVTAGVGSSPGLSSASA